MLNLKSLLLCGLLASTAGANAALVTYSSFAAWQAVAGPVTGSQNFNGFAVDTNTTLPVDLGSGISVSSVGAMAGPWGIDVAPIDNAFECSVDGTAHLCGSNGNVLTFEFAAGLAAFGADFSSINDAAERTALELFSGNTLIATLVPTTVVGQTDQFFGFVATAGESITSFRTKSINGLGDTFGIDNISVVSTTAVPEPATLALVGIALLGIAASPRRKPGPAA